MYKLKCYPNIIILYKRSFLFFWKKILSSEVSHDKLPETYLDEMYYFVDGYKIKKDKIKRYY